MAQPVCNFCEQEYGVIMVTDLIDPSTNSIGGQCLIGYAMSLAAAVTANISPDGAEAYGELFDQIAANDSRRPRVVPPTEPGKRRKPGPKESSAAPESGTSPTSSDTSEKTSDPPESAQADEHFSSWGAGTPQPDDADSTS